MIGTLIGVRSKVDHGMRLQLRFRGNLADSIGIKIRVKELERPGEGNTIFWPIALDFLAL